MRRCSYLVCLSCFIISTLVLFILSCFFLNERNVINNFNNSCKINLPAILNNNTVIQVYQCLNTDKLLIISQKQCVEISCNDMITRMSSIDYCIIDNNNDCEKVDFKKPVSFMWIIGLTISIMLGIVSIWLICCGRIWIDSDAYVR